MNKRCGRCRQVLEVSAFRSDASRADGRDPWCRLCRKARRAEILAARAEGTHRPYRNVRILTRVHALAIDLARAHDIPWATIARRLDVHESSVRRALLRYGLSKPFAPRARCPDTGRFIERRRENGTA